MRVGRILLAGLALSAGVSLGLGVRVARGQGLDQIVPGAIPGFQSAPGLARITARRRSAQPLGYALQDLHILPSLTLTPGYDSAPALATSGSASLEVAPQIRLLDPVLGLVGVLGVSNTDYAQAPRQNATSMIAALGWRVQVGRDRVDVGVARVVSAADALGLVSSPQVGISPVGTGLTYQAHLRAMRANWRHRFGMFTVKDGIGLSRSRIVARQFVPAFRTATTLQGQVRAISTSHALLRFLTQIDAQHTHYAGVIIGAPFGTTEAVGAKIGLATPARAIITWRALVGLARVRVAGVGHTGGLVPVFTVALGWMPDRLSAVAMTLSRTDSAADGLTLPGHPIERAGLAVALGYDRRIVLEGGLRATQAAVPGGLAREAVIQAGLRWRIGRMITVAPDLTEAWRHRVPGLAAHEFRAELELRFAP